VRPVAPRLGVAAALAGAGAAALVVIRPGAVGPPAAAALALCALAVVAAVRSAGNGVRNPWGTVAAGLGVATVATAVASWPDPAAVVPTVAAAAVLCSAVALLTVAVRRAASRTRHDDTAASAQIVFLALVTVLFDLRWRSYGAGGFTTRELAATLATAADAAVVAHLALVLPFRTLARNRTALTVTGATVVTTVLHLAWTLPASSSRPGAALVVAPVLAALAVVVVALSPARDGVGPAPGNDGLLGPGRIVLVAACGVVPLLLLLSSPMRGNGASWVVALSGVVLFCLLAVRVGGVLTGRFEDHRREAALRGGLTALVAATDHTTIELAAVLAARNLLDDPGATVRLLPGRPGQDVTVAGPGRTQQLPDEAARAVRPAEDRPWVVCVAVPSSKGLDGMLVAAASREPSSQLLDAFRALTGQLGLVRERAALADTMHRRHAEHRLASLVQHAFDVITIVDESLVVQFQSPSITAMLGHDPARVLHTAFSDLLAPEEAGVVEAQLQHVASGPARATTRVECRLRHRSGDWLDVELTATNLLTDPDVSGLVLNIRDVSERKALEQQLIRQAFHDPLTGLANRVLLADRVDHALQLTGRGGPEPAVLFIDLDDFKVINDSLGHPAGDRLLVELADRLSESLRPGDTAARMGGDEFAVLLENANGLSPEALHDVAQRVLERVCEPMVIDGNVITPRASIGVASGAGAGSATDLLRNADLAMYIAKEQGGGVAIFEPSMHDSARRRLEMQAELSRALDRNEFELHFQPIVALADETGPADRDALVTCPAVIGVEALVRWNHPERGRIPPVEFIPLAEDTGLIVELGRWVLMEACRTVASWAAEGLTTSLSLTVNVSARQLKEASLVEDVAWAISSSGIDPSWLVIEITESVVMHDTTASVGWLQDLKQLGVRIAIDDFGTGYSSLAYLQLFPIDVMKIDRSFVIGLGTDAKATELVRAVINLSDSLGMTTLAEGIETVVQLAELQQLGCRLGQGFAFARPMSAPALITALDEGTLVMARPGHRRTDLTVSRPRD
jgi:diguanylate cyclase (GGDEF)-like protein/PAS domain S-box-containing protein